VLLLIIDVPALVVLPVVDDCADDDDENSARTVPVGTNITVHVG
jgi:hypothetical protein